MGMVFRFNGYKIRESLYSRAFDLLRRPGSLFFFFRSRLPVEGVKAQEGFPEIGIVEVRIDLLLLDAWDGADLASLMHAANAAEVALLLATDAETLPEALRRAPC